MVGFKMPIICLHMHIKIVGVCHERLIDDGDVGEKLLPLDSRWIKGVKNYHLVVLRTVAKVRPVEPIRIVVLLFYRAQHSVRWIFVVALV